jgi:hypothetical protein
MKSIQEIELALKDAEPGTVLMIRSYLSSDGNKSDLEIELLDRNAYAEMLAEDLRILRESDIGDLFTEESESGDLTLTDMITAREQLIAAREAALARRNSDEEPIRRGPDYISVGLSTAKHPDNENALYIRGVKEVNGGEARVKPAKGAIPRAKQQLEKLLNLPSRRYVHSVKLELGKFEDLQVYSKALSIAE